jgi:hypothetical protein
LEQMELLQYDAIFGKGYARMAMYG